MNHNHSPESEPIEPVVIIHRDTLVRRLSRRFGLSALTISLAVHAVFLLLATFFFYQWVYQPIVVSQDPVIVPIRGGGGNQGASANKLRSHLRSNLESIPDARHQLATNTGTYVVSNVDTSLSQAMVPLNLGAGSSGLGGGAGGGRGIGVGLSDGPGMHPGSDQGQGKFFMDLDLKFKPRCTEAQRQMMLREAGGTPAIEEGVKKSLQWLKTQQHPDGSWGNSYQVGITGLVLLCYLGHCEFTLSDTYGDTVQRAIAFLINAGLASEGRLSSQAQGNQWVYEHAIGTYALSEALTFSRTQQFPIPHLEDVVTKAANRIIAGQNQAGAWDYEYRPEGRNDLSVTGWQLQSLKAAKEARVKLPELERTIRRASEYLTKTAAQGDGLFEYSGGQAHPSMSAVAALCLQLWDRGNSSQARGGVRLIFAGLEDRAKGRKANEPAGLYAIHYDGSNADLYSWYYASQVMRNAGGREWAAMNQAILEEILPAQGADGQFKEEGGGGRMVHVGTAGAGTSRTLYRQTLATLILEVYYRFLPGTNAGRSGNHSAFDSL